MAIHTNHFRVAMMLFVGVFIHNMVHAQGVVNSSDSSALVKPTLPPPIAIIKPKAPKVISKEWSMGYRLNSNGWSIYSELGKLKTNDVKHIDMFHSVKFLQFEIGEKKDPRQEKFKNENVAANGSNSYVYGKINNFYQLKLGAGYRKLLAGKPEEGSISIHWTTSVGGSLGLLKPYYLNVSGSGVIKYSEDDEKKFLNNNYILGGAGFSSGLGELTYVPGGYLRSALHFDFSSQKKTLIAVEAGVNGEYYSSEVKLMAYNAPVTSFYEMFVSVQIGTRW